MGKKKKKDHKKKVENRNQKLKNDAKYHQRQRAKYIKQLMEEQMEKEKLKKEQEIE